MSIITPSDTALAYLAELTIGQQRFDLSEQSDSSGHSATRLGGPPRWTAALRTLDALEPAISAIWKAIAVQLRGRVNHLALYDITQPQPRGTARGNMSLGSSASAGATTISIADCSGTNYLVGGSFESDTNADGVGDGWTRYSTGSTGTLSASIGTGMPVAGTKNQTCDASALAPGAEHGVRQLGVGVSALAGQTVAIACSVAANGGTRAQMACVWKDGGGSTIGTLTADVLATGGQQDISASGLCPSNAATADVYVYQYSGSGGSGGILIDAARLVLGSTSDSYPAAPTLLVGDWLQISTGVGSHYCMVVADATANDGGVMSVTIEPPLRKAFTGASAVAWNKPRAHFKQRPDAVSWSGVAGGTGSGGFALDLMEDWSA